MIRRLSSVLLAALVLIPVTVGLAQEAPRLRILVVNDDGYQAPGLVALVDSLVPIAEVIVVAPLEQQSGTGHGITYREPIKVLEFGNRYALPWYAIDAKPATCVRLALTVLMDSLPPDLVVSGINTGDNVGASAWISGTVAAAREGALNGIPAIAVSVGVGSHQDYEIAAGYARQLVERLRALGKIAPPLLLNVNVPAGGPAGIKVAPMSLVLGEQAYDRRYTPRGQLYFWDAWSPPEGEAVEGSDHYWFSRGYVTVTPLRIDQTDTSELPILEQGLNRK
jgi:5'-nucleotidase